MVIGDQAVAGLALQSNKALESGQVCRRLNQEAEVDRDALVANGSASRVPRLPFRSLTRRQIGA
jgi:hypothetical protein